MRARYAMAIVAALGAFFHSPPSAAAPHYDALVLSDQAGGPAKSTFASSTEKIYLHAKLVDVAKGSVAKSDWIAEKTQVAAPNFRMDGVELKVGALMNSVDFNMSKPTKTSSSTASPRGA